MGRQGGIEMRSGMSTAAAEPGALIGGGHGARGRRQARLELDPPHVTWDFEAELERELAKNASTWKALERLGVRTGQELPLHFYFESAGKRADRELAGFLRGELGYDAEADADGVNGRTPALALSPELLDEWVYEMFVAGYERAGCRFAGWSATVTRP
jgi:hypothetical protein